MSSALLKKIEAIMDRHRMLADGDCIVAAVSGGPDSVALLLVLKHFSLKYRLELIAAHLNHGLESGPADQGERFVRQLCAELGVTFESRKRDIALLAGMSKKSIEEAAREERYRFLEEVRQRYRGRKIALGHHAQDQAETVLMNLLRGSGREGLRGMQPVREGIYIRPLLEITRAEICDYLSEQNRSYLMDPSNDDEGYLRNRVRHRLVPELKVHYNPRLEEQLCRTAEIFRLEDDFLKQTVESLCADPQIVQTDGDASEVRIFIPGFLKLHAALQRRLIKHLLLTQADRKQGIGYVHVQDVETLMQRAWSGGTLHLPFGMEVRREFDSLVIGCRKGPPRGRKNANLNGEITPAGLPEQSIRTCDVPIPGRIQIEGQRLALSFDLVGGEEVHFGEAGTEYLDYACIHPPLRLRAPQPGDRIHPLGMSGTKKLKKLFIDRKVPRHVRTRIPVLADGRSVIWIAGQAIDERVKVTERTSNVLRIEMTEII